MAAKSELEQQESMCEHAGGAGGGGGTASVVHAYFGLHLCRCQRVPLHLVRVVHGRNDVKQITNAVNDGKVGLCHGLATRSMRVVSGNEAIVLRVAVVCIHTSAACSGQRHDKQASQPQANTHTTETKSEKLTGAPFAATAQTC